MSFKNIDGVIIEKEVEKNLVSIYKSMGWKIKDKSVPKKEEEKSFTSFKKNK